MKSSKIFFSLTCAILISFSLSAQPINTFPYTQDFESFPTCPGSCNATCILPSDWLNLTTDDANWITDVNGTSSSNTGPSVDHTFGTSLGKYLYVESSFPCYPNRTAILQSPEFNLNSLENPTLKVFIHQYGSRQGTTSFLITNNGGATWLPIGPMYTGNLGDVWNETIIDLSAFTNNTVQMRVQVTTSTSFTSDVAIDDFSIYGTAPMPPIPTVSEWGLIFLFLGFLSVGSAWMLRRQRRESIA